MMRGSSESQRCSAMNVGAAIELLFELVVALGVDAPTDVSSSSILTGSSAHTTS